jgi:hypothetical protein
MRDWKKKEAVFHMENGLFLGSGDWTRTSDLWVMSPTSYQLLHPALFGSAKVGKITEGARPG